MRSKNDPSVCQASETARSGPRDSSWLVVKQLKALDDGGPDCRGGSEGREWSRLGGFGLETWAPQRGKESENSDITM